MAKSNDNLRAETSPDIAVVPADLEGAHESLVHTHHAAGVVELAAVVGGGEEGDELPLREELVSVLDNLEHED